MKSQGEVDLPLELKTPPAVNKVRFFYRDRVLTFNILNYILIVKKHKSYTNIIKRYYTCDHDLDLTA